MLKKIKVIEVTEAPDMNKPAIQQGIRDKAAAESWGARNGYETVYYIPRKQKVYAERKNEVSATAEK